MGGVAGSLVRVPGWGNLSTSNDFCLYEGTRTRLPTALLVHPRPYTCNGRLEQFGLRGSNALIYHLRSLNASTPPSIIHTKQNPTAHSGPGPLSRKPKSQPQRTVLMPAAKSRMPATAPGERPARSLPMAA